MSYVPPPLSLFTGMTQAQLMAALQSAQAAYLKLSTGSQLASASYAQGDGGKTVSFRQADTGQLSVLILQLQEALGMRRARRPIRYVFR